MQCHPDGIQKDVLHKIGSPDYNNRTSRVNSTRYPHFQGFCICKFSYSLKCICNPNNTSWHFWGHSWVCVAWQKLVCHHHICSQLRANRVMLSPLISALLLQKSVLFTVHLMLHLKCLCFLLVISLFMNTMATKYSTKVLFSVLKCKRIAMCLVATTHVLDKLHSTWVIVLLVSFM